MLANRLRRGIYLITEHDKLGFEQLVAITALVLPGISALQYRNKIADRSRRHAEATVLQQLCRNHGVPFIMNDDPDLALELGADGVHLGQEDGNCRDARLRIGTDRLIGSSCYNQLERAEEAVQQGADYIAFGAMFPTSSKKTTVAATTGLIREAKQRYTVPIVAIGGITPQNCVPVIEAGADLLAVISSVYLAPDPLQAIGTFNQLMTRPLQ